jgi:hypoxanthine-DNA glycosylase
VTKRGFAPLATPAARVLILGSLPGEASLRAGEYYAQPRNGFWPILDALVGTAPGSPYAERVARLTAAGIALWDVCAAARRAGSLDSAIERDSVVINDFAAFHAAHPRLRAVAFNGRTAAALYRRHALPTLDDRARALPLLALPSTSPAHAALARAAKLRQWHAVLAPVLGSRD